MTSYAVLIARVQPFHNAHHAIVKHALSKYDRLLLCVGSARQARSPKNPFTAAERVELVKAALTPEEVDRVTFIPVRDQFYQENRWLTDVQRRVKEVTVADPGPIAICGRLKDRSTYYLRLFPQWTCDEYGREHPFDATKIRRALVEGDMPTVEDCVPHAVYERLRYWRKTETFAWVKAEHEFYEAYRSRYIGAPYPPTFVTADSVVVQAGHVLLVRRRSAPGKGLLALPGGFIAQDESIEASALRELKEETKIDVPTPILRASIVDRRVFDHPDRSLRGRVITTAHYIRLEPKAKDDYDLPTVRGSDDADRAFWMPLDELADADEEFFEDHAHIVRALTARY